MPIYEFACQSCGATFEARVARVGARPDACPECGGAQFDKLMSSFAAHTAGGAQATPPCGMGAQCGRVTGRGCGGAGAS